jgi:hypothetical protein
MENMFKSKKEQKKIKEYKDKYSAVLANWEKDKAPSANTTVNYIGLRKTTLSVGKQGFAMGSEKKEFLNKQDALNVAMEQQKKKYLSKDPATI